MLLLCLQILTLIVLTLAAAFACVCSYLHKYLQNQRTSLKKRDDRLTIAFFHPYCNSCGGGEKVLWHAVRTVQNTVGHAKIVIYTGDVRYSSDDIVRKVKDRFDISVGSNLEFVYLHKRHWLEAHRYPYFTLLAQSIASLFLGLEAIFSFLPDIFIDTTGCAFTLPVFSCLGGCVCASYVHYPTISTDMLSTISRRVCSYNNRSIVARSAFLSKAKIIYYKAFAWLYGRCGRLSDCVMVNSSWTENHINQIWNIPAITYKVFPPCDTVVFKSLQMSPDIDDASTIKIIYLAQFRPEKDHPLLLRSMVELKKCVSDNVWCRIRLIFIGSCRNEEDEKRVKDLTELSKKLSVFNNVEFKVNVPFEDLKRELQSCVIGAHAMWNEHFGISVVECMAAGQIMVAHKSGGPKADIIDENESSRNGFLASTEQEYSQAFANIINLTPESRTKIRNLARSSSDRFNNKQFYKNFTKALEPIVSLAEKRLKVSNEMKNKST